MKDSSMSILATKTILLSIFGLSIVPFLAIILQYIDSIIGFSNSNGYYTNSNVYISKGPLIYIVIVLWINIIWGIFYLVYYCSIKRKR